MKYNKSKRRLHHLPQGDELVHHAQDEVGPEDVESLQHQQQSVEEVVARERIKIVQRIDHGRVDHPGNKINTRSLAGT